MATNPQYNFWVNRADLDFMLKQIKISEASTLPDGSVDRATLLAQIGGVGADVTSAALLPFGLRTVDGTWNNLLPGQERFGAADNIMPRLTALNLDPADPIPAGFPGAGSPTTYASNSGFVFDAQPRLASNLIVDQTAGNPAAVQAAAGLAADGVLGVLPVTANGSLSIPNLSPDIGLSPPFNGWTTLFGQFFDHGLDLIGKGRSGTVFVPLQPDDPLFVPGSPTNFMVLTRATNQPGPDGIVGDNPATPLVNEAADDVHEHKNSVSPFIDQNQTYTSHPSHQVFLREYTLVGGDPIATGKLLAHTVAGVGITGEGTWADLKLQAATMLGIRITDQDVFNVPLLATDRYGEFIRGPNGYVQVVTATGLVEGDPAANAGQGVFLPANTIRTGHAFLDDIAHNAAPGTFDNDGNPATPQIPKTPDLDTTPGAPNPAFNPALTVGGTNLPFLPQPTGTYDNETLDRHFMTGDGRGNENIGLTAVHTIFHSEHNRTVEMNKETILAQRLESGAIDLAFINEWMRTPITAAQATANVNLPWDGERLFQAARFSTEMQYQHMVFEEFGRSVSPTIDPFLFSNSTDINPAIFAEFANVVYRFGHSMLTETVDRTNFNMTTDNIGLIQAFLNPLEFNKSVGAAGVETIDDKVAVGAIVRGMTRQVGNAIDEFVTEALRNNLVGLPLDLAVLNMARARETGMPSFNEARAQFFAMTGDTQLQPFTSWADMAPNLKHSASIVNFIAAYGTHPSIEAALTADGKRAAALTLVMGGAAAPADRVDFLNSVGTWAGRETGLNDVDFWIGGLAEFVNEFQGMLGPTFNFVFEQQMENLQNGDRFYYLSRTQGMNMLNQLENNSFSKLIARNSDIGEVGGSHLPGNIFMTPNWILEVNQAAQLNLALANGPGRDGILLDDPLTLVNEAADNTTATSDPFGADAILEAINPMVQRGANFLKYSGAEHVVLGGSAGADTLRGGRGIDALWGDAGNDRLDGGDEADKVMGGDGDDIITDHGTPAGGADFLHGDNGNDVISGGTGNDVLFGGTGNDFVMTGNDSTRVFGGEGNDFILGGNGPEFHTGNEGDDWMEGGEGLDGLHGDNSELFFNSPIIGHDVLNGQGNDTDYDGESGNDIMVQGPGIQRSNGMLGFDWAIHKGDPVGANSDLGIGFFPTQTVFTLRDRFDLVEGLSGWRFNDNLVGTSSPTGQAGGLNTGIIGAPASDSMLQQKHVGMISGLQNLLGVPATLNPEAVVFNPQLGADILIGGAGSDVMEGKAGNDLIDGDSWLNVRIAIAPGANPAPASAESLNDIKAMMLAGTINPGQLSIVREIVTTGVNATDLDVAVYNGPSSDYTIAGATDAFGGRRVIITDNVLTPVVINGLIVPLLNDEGTDTLRNVERARFITRDAAGLVINVEDIVIQNSPPTGSVTVTETTAVNLTTNLRLGGTPTEGQALASTVALVDPEGIASAFAYQWEASIDGVNWAAIAGATAANFTPTQAEVGTFVRVMVSYIDGAGFTETFASGATTTVVGDVVLAADFVNPFNGTAGDDVATGNGGANTLNGNAGNDILSGGAGADILNGGTGADRMTGGTENDTYLVDDAGDVVIEVLGGGIDRVDTTLNVYSFADGAQNNGSGVALDNLTFIGTGDFTGTGNLQNNTIIGGAGNDTLDGGLGNDIMNGGLGNDTLVGGAGADGLNGGGGDDVLTGGTGTDTMTGGAGADDFIYTALNQSVAGGARDIIADFLAGSDQINLNAIDADSVTPGNQDFTFIGTAAFSAVGQVRVATVDGLTRLQANVDPVLTNNGLGADFSIQLTGVAPAAFLAVDLIP